MHSIKLGQYKDLQIKKVPPMNEEELNNAAEKAFKDAIASIEKFAREIQAGDIILVKLEAKVGDEVIKELCKDQMEYDVGNLSMLPEYSKAIGKKVTEEAGECVIEAVDGNRSRFVYEASDLLYHSLVLLEQMGVSLDDIERELALRHR